MKSQGGNSALQTITIPDSVQYIGKSAFSGTPWLEAQTDEFVIVGEGVLIDYNSPAAKAGANTAGEVVEMAIPDGVKCISFSFDESTVERYEVTIPASVRSIEDKAFCNASIESIRFEDDMIPKK